VIVGAVDVDGFAGLSRGAGDDDSRENTACAAPSTAFDAAAGASDEFPRWVEGCPSIEKAAFSGIVSVGVSAELSRGAECDSRESTVCAASRVIVCLGASAELS
jgi:hypothetical protein